MVAKCSQIFPKIVSKLFRSCSKVAIVSILSQKCPKVVFRNIPNGTQCCPCSSQMVPEGLYLGYHKPTDNWVSTFHLAEVAGIVLAHCCYWRPMWSEKLGRVDQLQVGIAMRAPGGAGNSMYQIKDCSWYAKFSDLFGCDGKNIKLSGDFVYKNGLGFVPFISPISKCQTWPLFGFECWYRRPFLGTRASLDFHEFSILNYNF